MTELLSAGILNVDFNSHGQRIGMRWFGPRDAVNISQIAHTPGVTDVISALHDDVVKPGEVWTEEAIAQRKIEIEFHADANEPRDISGLALYRWYHEHAKRTGLIWSTVESLPFVEQVKNGGADRDAFIEKFNISMINLGKFGAAEFGAMGIKTVVGNFMLMADWTRTGYAELPNGSKALEYHHPTFAAFDIFILKRNSKLPGNATIEQIFGHPVTEEEIASYITDGSYTAKEIAEAREVWRTKLGTTVPEAETPRHELKQMIMAGLPGAQEGFDLTKFRQGVLEYKGKTVGWLRENISYFLGKVVPVAKEAGINLCVHPDDPAYSPFMGTPRSVGSVEGYEFILKNGAGVNLCPGSLMADPKNRDIMQVIFDLHEAGTKLGMTAEQIFPHVHFRPITTNGRSYVEGEHATHVEELANLAYALAEIDWKGVGRPDHAPTLNHGAGDRGYHGVGRGYGANVFVGLLEMARDQIAMRRATVDAVIDASGGDAAKTNEAIQAARETGIKFMMEKATRHQLSPAFEGQPGGNIFSGRVSGVVVA